MKKNSDLGSDGIMYTCIYMIHNYTTNKNIKLTFSCVDVFINPKEMNK